MAAPRPGQISDINMEAMDVIVNWFVGLWSKRANRIKFSCTFLLISVAGSILKELDIVPQTYFSSSGNFINVYFVKLSWGWTLLLLTPFVLLLSNSSSSRESNVSCLSRRVLCLVVATLIWFVCTKTFFYIEDATGSCFENRTFSAVKPEFVSKATCRQAGFHWHGFDISGHSFILSYSSLLITEEMNSRALLRTLRTSNLPAHLTMLLSLLYVALNVILIMWVWMFACTSVYFHDTLHKLLGTTLGLLVWYVTYGVCYGKLNLLPPQPKEEKQQA